MIEIHEIMKVCDYTIHAINVQMIGYMQMIYILIYQMNI